MEVAAKHIAHLVAYYIVVATHGYTVLIRLLAAVVQTAAKVTQGGTIMEVVVCTVPVLLDALLTVVLALSRVPPFSQSMNRMSFLGANHMHGSLCHHVQLTDKMYSTSSLLW